VKRVELDVHGQPRNLYLNAQHRWDKAVHELLGLIRGVLVDGVVSPTEVLALDLFFDRYPDLISNFPGKALYQRIHPMLAAGRFADDELEDLRGLLEDTIGDHHGVHDFGEQESTALPFTAPPPTLVFPRRCFVVTGRFIFGARTRVEDAIHTRGGECEDTVTRRTDVLIVGSLASTAPSAGRSRKRSSSRCPAIH
jgi:hypothetical protein